MLSCILSALLFLLVSSSVDVATAVAAGVWLLIRNSEGGSLADGTRGGTRWSFEGAERVPCRVVATSSDVTQIYDC